MGRTAEKTLALQAERREAIVHAAWRMAASGGLGAVTIRSIAAEIGFTTGIVMHHFATKEEILEEMIDRLFSGLRRTYREAAAKAGPQDRLERMLLACLPLKPATVFGWRLSVVLQGEALRSPAIAKLHQRHYRVFEDDINGELRQLKAANQLSRHIDTELECARIISLVEGIGTNHVLRPRAMPARVQRQLLLDELSRLLRP